MRYDMALPYSDAFAMKTTVEISNATLSRVRLVQQHGAVSLKALIDEGLNMAIEHRLSTKPFRLALPSVSGQGLSAQAQHLGMPEVLRLAADSGIDTLADLQ